MKKKFKRMIVLASLPWILFFIQRDTDYYGMAIMPLIVISIVLGTIGYLMN